MKIYYWQQISHCYSKGEKLFTEGSGISVGSFDGLHKGHRMLVKKLTDYCSAKKLLSGAVTFSRPLPSLKNSSEYKGDVSTLNQRLQIFEELKLDFIILVEFTTDFAALNGTDFFEILHKVCNLQFLAEGVDFRCGYKGATDTEAIRFWAQSKNIETDFLPPVIYKPGTLEEERISSSYIRAMIYKGAFIIVEQLLERPYQIELNSEDIKIENNELYIEKKLIKQVLPQQGTWICKDNIGEEIKVKINNDKVYLSAKAESLYFKK